MPQRAHSFGLRFRREPAPMLSPFPPIEKTTADLRRLHRISETLPCGASFVRTIGVLHAYDQTLDVACRQLGVATRLLALPDGAPRILERLRVEFELTECGLSF